MTPLRFATVWLDGCSGCHMSLLDLDAKLLELVARVQIVYSPLTDAKHYPEQVDIVCVEGAVSTTDDLRKLQIIRQRTAILIAMGDCAVTGNVPGMRNMVTPEAVLASVYPDLQQRPSGTLHPRLPLLLAKALPLHHYVPVDHFLPGCPPSADALAGTIFSLVDRHGHPAKNAPGSGA